MPSLVADRVLRLILVVLERASSVLQRFVWQIKVVGLLLLAYHCVTTGFGFNPLWIVVSLLISSITAVASTSIWALVRHVAPVAREPVEGSTDEWQQMCEQAERMIQPVKRNPWLFLLIPGEDGAFFLPLLYIGISPLTASMAAGLFTLAHYRIKPGSSLPGTFVLSFLNVMIVLPHGILPMVLAHLILDGVAVFYLANYANVHMVGREP